MEIHGRWEIGATVFNFQGLDRRAADTPNDVKLYVYLYDLKADRAYLGPVDFEIRHDGQVVARFHRSKVDEEAVYSTRETLPESGEYQLVAHMDGMAPSFVFQVDLAADRINWMLVIGLIVPVGIIFALAFVGRRRRRRRVRHRKPVVVATLALLITLAMPDLGYTQHGTMNHATMNHSAAHDHSMHHERAHAKHMQHGERAVSKSGTTMEHHMAPDGTMVMVMGGLPLWMFFVGVGSLLLLSFVATEKLAPVARRGFRLNIAKRKSIYRLLQSRWLQVIPQLVMIGLLLFLIYAGLFGSRATNVTPIAVWTIWWAGLIFAVLLFAALWCFVCPWDGLANLVSRLRLAARVETLSLKLPFPDALKTLYPAIVLFFGLTWLELGFGVTTDPRWTAYMGIGMAAMAMVSALLWEGKRFCAHLCPVGRICGIYGNFSPFELRARNTKTCEVCSTEDCLHGNERGYACPTGISLKTMTASTMCTMCTECIKSCNKRNVALNIRPFGSDLRTYRTPRLDEAWLALSLLALTLFHGFSMTSAWQSFRPGDMSRCKVGWPDVRHINHRKFYTRYVGGLCCSCRPVLASVLGRPGYCAGQKDNRLDTDEAVICGVCVLGASGRTILPLSTQPHASTDGGRGNRSTVERSSWYGQRLVWHARYSCGLVNLRRNVMVSTGRTNSHGSPVRYSCCSSRCTIDYLIRNALQHARPFPCWSS